MTVLRANNVQPHEDGLFHAHISPSSNSQLFADNALQRALTALPDHPFYQQGFIGEIGGIGFFMNTESPTDINTGAFVATGALSRFSPEIGAETRNATGVRIGRVLVTGKGALYERGLDESAYVSEAGVTGKIGEFDIMNAGIKVAVDRVRLILRAPINAMMDTVRASWSCTTGFPVPSDVLSGTGPQRNKRALVIQHSLGM